MIKDYNVLDLITFKWHEAIEKIHVLVSKYKLASVVEICLINEHAQLGFLGKKIPPYFQFFI